MLDQVRTVIIFLTLIIFTSSVVALGNAERGAKLNIDCVACHGPDGNSLVEQWPKIAGQYESYIYQQIKEIQKGQSGKRFEPTMLPVIQNLSDQDIKDLAAFYATQKMSRGEATNDTVALGRNLYRYGDLKKGIPSCMSCHGPSGLGNDLANIPKLGGQHKDYVVASLESYKSETRKTGANGIMQDVSQMLTKDEMEAVGNYISGLHE